MVFVFLIIKFGKYAPVAETIIRSNSLKLKFSNIQGEKSRNGLINLAIKGTFWKMEVIIFQFLKRSLWGPKYSGK